MPLSHLPGASPLTRMADGTIKQVNPFTGTQVWTVPGRGHRPLGSTRQNPATVELPNDGRHCALCHLRYRETPPEKARLVRHDDGNGNGGDGKGNGGNGKGNGGDGGGNGGDGNEQWLTLHNVPAERLFDQVAELRRIPNLFEILSFDYWHANYGHDMSPEAAEAMRSYLATDSGREHVLAVVRARLAASGVPDDQWAAMGENERLEPARAFFGGSHDLIVARRHYLDDATHDDDLASSGSLTPEEHALYIGFTVDAMAATYAANRYARYVAVFQNWLKPAGASFDHLHKQLVAIDERGVQAELELRGLRLNPNLYNEAAVNYAAHHNLVIAENEHAIAFAGFGHRYPTLEVFSKSAEPLPWRQSPEEVRGMSDLLHACHAATGAAVPCNEEWHHRPADVDVPMPWRIMVK